MSAPSGDVLRTIRSSLWEILLQPSVGCVYKYLNCHLIGFCRHQTGVAYAQTTAVSAFYVLQTVNSNPHRNLHWDFLFSFWVKFLAHLTPDERNDNWMWLEHMVPKEAYRIRWAPSSELLSQIHVWANVCGFLRISDTLTRLSCAAMMSGRFMSFPLLAQPAFFY